MPDFKFKSAGVQVGDPSLKTTRTSPPIGIKTPLRLGRVRSGIFDMNYTLTEQIADNLRNLLMTNHGERLGNFSYGANLLPLTFEASSREEFETIAMQRIQLAVTTFMPFVELTSFSSDFDGDSSITFTPGTELGNREGGITVVNIKIAYTVPKIGQGEGTMTIQLTSAG